MLTEVVSVHGAPHEPSSLTACRQWHSAQKQARQDRWNSVQIRKWRPNVLSAE